MRIRTKSIYEVSFPNTARGRREARSFKNECKRSGAMVMKSIDQLAITITVHTRFEEMAVVDQKTPLFWSVC